MRENQINMKDKQYIKKLNNKFYEILNINYIFLGELHFLIHQNFKTERRDHNI